MGRDKKELGEGGSGGFIINIRYSCGSIFLSCLGWDLVMTLRFKRSMGGEKGGEEKRSGGVVYYMIFVHPAFFQFLHLIPKDFRLQGLEWLHWEWSGGIACSAVFVSLEQHRIWRQGLVIDINILLKGKS